jgi:hypothetical protein
LPLVSKIHYQTRATFGFAFSPAQSDYGLKKKIELSYDSIQENSIIYIGGKDKFDRSSAFFKIEKDLKGWPRCLSILRFFS